MALKEDLIINTSRIDHLYQDHEANLKLILHHGDLTDSTSLVNHSKYSTR